MMPLGAIIVGAQKAGTSAVLGGLRRSGRVLVHDRPEFSYFLRGEEHRLGWDAAIARDFAGHDGPLPLVAKNVGILYSTEAMDRLARHRSDIPVFVFLRDPVKRAYSAYWYARSRGWENVDSFSDALDMSLDRFSTHELARANCDYLGRGEYARHLEALFERFDRRQVRVYCTDDLRVRGSEIIEEIIVAAGGAPGTPVPLTRDNASGAARSEWLARAATSPGSVRKALRAILPPRWRDAFRRTIARFNRREFEPPPMPAVIRRRLAEHYLPHNRRLETLLGRSFAMWSRG
jgi:hypothetical protein